MVIMSIIHGTFVKFQSMDNKVWPKNEDCTKQYNRVKYKRVRSLICVGLSDRFLEQSLQKWIDCNESVRTGQVFDCGET